MSDFRRQPSKVWWSTYQDEHLSQFSGFLGWGKGVDLSGNLTDNLNNKLTNVKNTLNSSKSENEENTTPENFLDGESREKKENKEKDQRQNLESDRDNSSSPSQGSHKSQDSGFSDSEVQNNALSLSPECSPELSGRSNCIQCNSKEESESAKNGNLESEKSYNETVANYRRLKTSVKSSQYEPVEFNLDICNDIKYLETAFDGNNETPVKGLNNVDGSVKTEPESDANIPPNSPKQKNRKHLIKNHISRTKCDTKEKFNQIQNQLEQSFKLPKKISLSKNLKLASLFSNHCHEDQEDSRNEKTVPSCAKTLKEGLSESIMSLKSLSYVRTKDNFLKKRESSAKVLWNHNKSSLDNDGFKVPKVPDEQSTLCKTNFLDFTEIGGPPISSSTPKSSKFQAQESPVPRTARATENKLTTRTTFATIRKLKEFPEKKSKGSVNLLNSFNRCSIAGCFPSQGKIIIDFESSVKHWLSELETMYEAEIMTTLQSKSLATDLTRQVTNLADTTSQTVRKLHQKTKTISLEFSRLCQQNKSKKEKQIRPLVQNLVEHITEFIKEYVQKNELLPQNVSNLHQRNEETNQRHVDKNKKDEESCHEMITDFRQAEPATMEVKNDAPTLNLENNEKKTKEEAVIQVCEKLKALADESQLDHEKIEIEVSNLGKIFTEIVDILLESHIQALVRVLEEPRTELALRTALSALTTLGLEGNHLSHLVSKCGGIRALLAVCLEARATAVRVSALRTLATVCCVSDTIRQFEEAGGVEIISDILADEKRLEVELSEASAVIAQITAPWVQDNHSVEGLSQFLNNLVTSLTRIVNNYKSSETLLLSAAALANLTFMEPRTVWPLLENETAKILLTAVRRQGPKVSVFIQEQAATVIANMASVPECRKHLAEHRAVVALLCFLQIHHSPLQRPPEISAAERVQQKSAIALSRLCSDVTVAKQVVELQGVKTLVRLCKEERERNHSDGVLVACLAALRKIAANCGTEALEELNAMELVEPRLLDSFLLYSSKQESYV